MKQETTASETNADYYSIERSMDGNLFSEIGRQSAAGNTTEISQYYFFDEELTKMPVNRIYYRLRQIDQDGSVDYSNVIELEFDPTENQNWIQAMPIPVADLLTVRYGNVETQSGALQVYNVTGQQLFSSAVVPGVGEKEIAVSSWSEGIYYLRLVGEKQQVVRKFTVKH